jgi:DNA-binding transcriptional LysR family regulator
MSFSQVVTFIAVAETGTLRGAARRLHISEPPLSRRLQELEHELGAALFLRSPRGMRLSVEGQRLLPHARAVMEAVAALREAVTAGRSPPDPSAIGPAIATDRTG